MGWKFLLLLLSFFGCLSEGKAQKIAVKTNLLWDAAANISIGAEYGVTPRWTVELSGGYNNWKMSSHCRRWKHWFIRPEARYWFCERFGGHFLGAYLHGGKFNVGHLKNGISFLGTDFSKLSHDRFQGWFVGCGASYGYSWMVGKRWNLEPEIGIGYSYCRYDRYPCARCGEKIESDKTHHYVGLTKLALNLVYLF